MPRVNASSAERADLRLPATSSRKSRDAATICFWRGERGCGEFQGVEAGFGGGDELAQAGEGLEAIVADSSAAGREGHINRERDVCDGLDRVVDWGRHVGFDAPPLAQQGEVIAVHD